MPMVMPRSRVLFVGEISINQTTDMPDVSIHTIATLHESAGAGVWNGTLSNGKRVLAHRSKPLADAGAEFDPGQQVLVEMTPYDFEIARIISVVPPPGE